MRNASRLVNLALSGGGIKGIAFIGAIRAAEQRGLRWANIAGVSAGALVGSLAGAGCTWFELQRVLDEFDCSGLDINEAAAKVPAVLRYIQYCKSFRQDSSSCIESFLNRGFVADRRFDSGPAVEFPSKRGNFLKNLVTFSKEGCLFDGDYLEEWIAGELRKRGVRTFADLRGGITDSINPRGYRVRMTAVDANRGRLIVLPDDIAYYGIDPDKLEVAKAVRMSTSVPFAFKPVEIFRKEGNIVKVHHFIDGGVFDNFPFWLVTNSPFVTKIGLSLDSGGKKKLLSLDTPLSILKALIFKSHDTGVPQNVSTSGIHIIKINTSKISFLDFNLCDKEKENLLCCGEKAAQKFFESCGLRRWGPNGLILFLRSLFRGKFFRKLY